ncbi:MAG: nitroreductase [Deltaproteobacteria bacterium]|nr:nitroreductase [Deltaproteobacteria bacterium]
MDTHQALLTRQSIRKYLKDPVPPESIEKIMTAATWAPSGSNTQPWRFYVAMGEKRDELLQALIEATGPDAPSMEAYEELAGRVEQALSEKLKESNPADPAGVSLLKLSDEAAQFVRFGSIRFYQAPVAIVVAAPKQMGGSASQSVGAAVQNLLLAAHAKGLATCWLGMPLQYKDQLIDVLGIPEDEVLITSVCLGYPDNESPLNNMGRSRLPYGQTVHVLS